jgi:hypothetical protein
MTRFRCRNGSGSSWRESSGHQVTEVIKLELVKRDVNHEQQLRTYGLCDVPYLIGRTRQLDGCSPAGCSSQCLGVER